MKDFMDELRKEYDGLNLSDEQIFRCKSIGITPEQISQWRESLKKMYAVLREKLDLILDTLGRLANSEELKTFETHYKKEKNIKRNKKGKPLKPWQKNSFYQ